MMALLLGVPKWHVVVLACNVALYILHKNLDYRAGCSHQPVTVTCMRLTVMLCVPWPTRLLRSQPSLATAKFLIVVEPEALTMPTAAVWVHGVCMLQSYKPLPTTVPAAAGGNAAAGSGAAAASAHAGGGSAAAAGTGTAAVGAVAASAGGAGGSYTWKRTLTAVDEGVSFMAMPNTRVPLQVCAGCKTRHKRSRGAASRAQAIMQAL